MGLKFKDIKDWKPTSISIVDKPGHPLAVFEVYEDDEEFIKKYSPIREVDKLTKETNDETVTMSSSFFEKLFGGLVSKADEPPAKPPAKEGDEEGDDKLDKILERLDSFDERIKKLENPEPAPGAVQKSEGAAGDGGEGQGEGEGEGGEATPNPEGDEGKEGDEGEEKPIVDDKTMVKKSKEVDPDLNKGTSAPTMSFMERIGRSEDGMKW